MSLDIYERMGAEGPWLSKMIKLHDLVRQDIIN
jgi:hypothetical protein